MAKVTRPETLVRHVRDEVKLIRRLTEVQRDVVDTQSKMIFALEAQIAAQGRILMELVKALHPDWEVPPAPRKM